jgi:hypothetical protein
MTEAEALAIVREQMIARDLRLEQFHLFPTLECAGSLMSELGPWPGEDVWVISVIHDLIHCGFCDSGGSTVYVNCRTREYDWQLNP